MNDLVVVKNKEVFVESNLVARKIGMKHNHFMKSVKEVIARLERSREIVDVPKYEIVEAEYRGQKFKQCLMSREFFSLVMMRFETDKAFEWQVNFNRAFYAMEKSLLDVVKNRNDDEWTGTRLIGKSARLEETDAIKEFIEYATAQGSQSAKFYYKHITNATYKGLGLMSQKIPNIRDQMNVYELPKLILCERLVTIKLREYMSKNRQYKDIYESLKNDLLDYAESLNLVNVLEQKPSHKD